MPESPTTSAVAATPGDPGQQPPATSNRSALLIVFLVVFIDLLGFGIVLPILPRIGKDYVSVLIPGQDRRVLVGIVVGGLMAMFSLMQFLVSPIWGRVSDRVGRRPILLVGLGGSVVFYALFGFACSLSAGEHAALALTLMFAARIGAGIAGATIATAQAVIADSTPPDKRKHGMALIGAAFGIGFTFGPLLGALALFLFSDAAGQSEHVEAVGYMASALSFVALLLGIRLLPETRQFDKTPPLDRRWVDWSAMRKVLKNPAIGPVVIAFFLATVGFASFETTLALFLQGVLGLGEKNSYLYFAYIGVVLMITQGFIYRRLASRFSEATFMLMGIVFMAAGLLGLGVVTWAAWQGVMGNASLMTLVLAALAVAVVGFAFMTPSAQALISRRTDVNQQGEVLGVNQSASALARIAGPAIGPPLYMLTDPPLLPYAFAAVLLLLMLPMMPKIRKG
ncbi:MAG TPA: MFS transporter [Gemmataceae bacterium]|nr:MFS transporter [Gemmataceae bacterium]